jgi:hypothetical protein
MEVSRSSPRGFFSSLKSLFVDRAPLYVPDVELHFFEGRHDLLQIPPQDRPTWTSHNKTPFPQQTTRFIWCAITVCYVNFQYSRPYTLSYTIYRPDGTVLSHRTVDKLALPLEGCGISSFTWRKFGYGWQYPGYWPTGVYQAEVLIDGVRSGTGSFTIAPPPPPPPPKPPEEVLQLPRVQFYASGRETIRFPQQSTREVICKLTVRNLLYQQEYRHYTVSVQWCTNEGRLLWEEKRNWTISSQEQEPSISWGCQTSGWGQGIYRVEIFIDGKEFAWGAFTFE